MKKALGSKHKTPKVSIARVAPLRIGLKIVMQRFCLDRCCQGISNLQVEVAFRKAALATAAVSPGTGGIVWLHGHAAPLVICWSLP